MLRIGRTPNFVAALALVAAFASRAGADQSILGKTFALAKTGGSHASVRLKASARETRSPNTLMGDPSVNGASITILMNGATSGSQTFVVPGGAQWKRSPKNPLRPLMGWKYSDSRGLNGPVTGIGLRTHGTFMIDFAAKGAAGGAVTIVPPNPATYVALMVTILGSDGDRYCVGFGGSAGGQFVKNSASALGISKPTAESPCPTVDPVCGDGVIQSPAEVCDVGNDAACPGLCGANGLPCLCPFCGDGVIDPGESCDVNALGTCTEGCTYACTCPTCGDGVVEPPTEACDPSDPSVCASNICLPPGDPNQCECAICGDGSVNQPSEQCDGSDSSACPGKCLSDCTCAVCGNGILEDAFEDCDPGGPGGNPAPADSSCPGACTSTCTCGYCGDDSVNQPSETCDGSDDAACPGNCDVGLCLCPVCGDGVVEGAEACDPGGPGGVPAPDDSDCPFQCSPTCQCPAP